MAKSNGHQDQPASPKAKPVAGRHKMEKGIILPHERGRIPLKKIVYAPYNVPIGEMHYSLGG